VLLPLTGRNASAGLQVRDGLLSAYYGDDTPDRVTLRFYDTGAQSIAQALGAANAAGASFVIGPLTRDEVNAAADAAPRLPVLALNFLTTEHAAPPRFRQFGLSPEDEARAVAKRVLADGRRRGIVFAPAGEWSERVVRVFKEEFTAGGGNLLDVQYLTGTKETAAAIQAALRIDDSKARHDRLQRILGTTLAFQPRRRGDLDFLFTPAPSTFARQLRPQLQFFFAGDIPAYATADAFDPAAGAQIDLDGVLLPDMPWIVQRDDAGYARLRNEAADAFGNDVPARGRLFALGHDAWRLQGLLRSNDQTVTLEGLTGTLALDANGRVQRTLEWARIDDGVPKPLDDKP
jgi:outer membrane PBP1 activator LpoA protein